MKMIHESKQLLRDAQLTMLQIARNDYSEQRTISPHVHEHFHQLVIVHKGSGEMQFNDSLYPVAGRYYYLIPPNSRHAFYFKEESVAVDYKFKLNDEGLVHAIAESPSYGTCTNDDLVDLKQWFQLTMEFSKCPDPLTLYRIDSGFKGTLLSLLQKSRGQRAEIQDASRMKDGAYSDFPIAAYINEHLSEKLSLLDIANHFGFHPHYIIKICNDHIGMSPMQYLQEKRLEKAMEYLEETKWTVTEISEKLGWTTSYFSRLFHQKKGISPSQFRKSAVYPISTDIWEEADHAAAGQ
ncbi:AraC family transcriptional regulator [Paenibacillus sp. 32352]|uniref:helix-turn-helix domain-containing protein n=1 Tax=Paenibacillus sp. 32352 TaxID=1969111 RepID=UPI0009AD82D0|nr:AraC family transcriptional regulator [Paenibacillus sp. 32352]